MDLSITLSALAVGFGISGLSIWLERRPRTSFDPPLVKPVYILMLGMLIILPAAVHLMTLLMRKP